MKLIRCLFCFLILTSCTSSYHNNQEQGENPFGGGFSDFKVDDGLFSIISKTNYAPWTDFPAAHATFTKRAMELCKSPNFKSMKLRETQYEHGYTPSAIKNIISQVDGYVICNPMILLDYKANEIIKEYESKVKASSSFILNNTKPQY
ncbi:hypothetical protein [Paraglaciecola sp.]|uniref:hypothetical protein n=1 Tax=Paraglaciecola sp. TaxID=1920173 RepID=UPI0032666558